VAARELTIAMKLIRSESGGRRTPVLTSSSYTGDGLDEVWDAVVAHRASLEESGSLAERRAEQQRDWMWALVRDDLLTALRRSPAVKALVPGLEASVSTGELSAVEASAEILAAFKADFAG